MVAPPSLIVPDAVLSLLSCRSRLSVPVLLVSVPLMWTAVAPEKADLTALSTWLPGSAPGMVTALGAGRDELDGPDGAVAGPGAGVLWPEQAVTTASAAP